MRRTFKLSATLATIICCMGIAGLFWLDRKGNAVSLALWIPQTWFMLACTRPVSSWFAAPSTVDLHTISMQITEGNAIDRNIGILLLILGITVLLNRRPRVRRCLIDCWPVLLFLAYCVLSISWSDFPTIAFKRLTREVGNLVMILVIWSERDSMTAIMRLIARITYTLIPVSILLAKYYPLGRSYSYWEGTTMYVGVADDKNTLGAICMLCGVAAVWQVLHLLKTRQPITSRSRQLLVQGIVLSLIVYLLAKANSVTSISCAVLVTSVLLASYSRFISQRRAVIHIVALLVILIPLSIALLGAMPGALEAMGRNSTLTDRTLIWSWVIKLVPNHWVGAGYGSFWLGDRLDAMIINVTHSWTPNQAHNGYLDVFANLGWIGVGLLAMVIIVGYVRVVRAWKQRQHASELMLAYFLTGVISNISEASFFRNLAPAWLLFLLAITMPTFKKRESPASRPSSVDLIGNSRPSGAC